MFNVASKMSEFEEKIKKLKKLKKVLALLGNLCYTKQVPNARVQNKTQKTDMAPWSSGQDASLSRWNQGFDSPRSH